MNKIKLSITLPADLVERIDREAQRSGRGNRSAIIETWLRRGARARAAEALREATLAYYASRTAEQEAEDASISRSAARHARRLRYDD